MIKNRLTLLLFIFSIKLFGQTVEPSVQYYKNGQLFWKGQHICDNGKTGGKVCYMAGFWTYWYENGIKKLETYHWFKNTYGDSRDLYINMWSADGKQILKDGSGIYYTDDTSHKDHCDSTVYEMKDSIKNGNFKSYRRYYPDKYFLVSYGQFKDGKPFGLHKFRDTIRLVDEEITYENGKRISNYKYLDDGLRVREEGKKIDWKKEGIWKFYHKGLIWKEVNYKDDNATGEIKEFIYNKKNKLIKTKTYMPDTNGSR